MVSRRHPAYDAKRFAAYLQSLLAEHNESYREASLRSGLDHGTMARHLNGRSRPGRDICLVLADHFGVHPNEVLAAAGYPPLQMLNRFLDPLTDDVKPIVEELSAIRDERVRREVSQSVQTLLTWRKRQSSR